MMAQTIMLLLDRGFGDEQLASAENADLRNVTAKVWDRVLSHCQARELRLYNIRLKNLDGIERLDSTTSLALEWATKVERLDPVFRMVQLERLSIFDFPRLESLEGIEALDSLCELSLSGSRASLSSSLKLASIAPATRLPKLRRFSLTNGRLADDDITSLAACSTLRSLLLSNQFERKQIAYLAKRLNPQLETPLRSYTEASMACPKCNGKMYMFTGRRMPFLCKACDAKRFEKLDREFEALVAGS